MLYNKKYLVWSSIDFIQPLPAEEEKELKDTLQEILGKGKKVKLEQKVIMSCHMLLSFKGQTGHF